LCGAQLRLLRRVRPRSRSPDRARQGPGARLPRPGMQPRSARVVQQLPPAVPAGAGAKCNAAGHCEVVQPPGVCPPTAPAEGSPCAPVSVVFCDYGDAPAVGCRDKYSCKGGAWTKAAPACTGVIVTTGCPDSCPAPPGACSEPGAMCKGADGSLSWCISGHWACSPPPPAPCPKDAPQNGQACTTAGLSCEYGLCGGVDGARRACIEGVWVDQWQYCLP
jgi:hypothetical protein